MTPQEPVVTIDPERFPRKSLVQLEHRRSGRHGGPGPAQVQILSAIILPHQNMTLGKLATYNCLQMWPIDRVHLAAGRWLARSTDRSADDGVRPTTAAFHAAHVRLSESRCMERSRRAAGHRHRPRGVVVTLPCARVPHISILAYACPVGRSAWSCG